mgnify:CR=1 FL=1
MTNDSKASPDTAERQGASSAEPAAGGLAAADAAASGKFRLAAPVGAFAMIVALVLAIALLTRGGGDDAASADPAAGMDSTERAATLEVALEDARRLLARQNEPEKAKLLLEKLIERFPDSQAAHQLLADAHFSTGDSLQAYEHMDVSLTLGEDHPEMRFATFMFAEDAELLDEALKHLLKAEELDPASVKYPVYMAALRLKRNEPQEAKASLLRAVQLDEGVAQAWGMLAQIAFDENKLNIAKQHVGKARELEPESTAYRVLEARILRRAMQPERAANVLMGVPDRQLYGDPMIAEELAVSLLMLGEKARAAQVYVDAAEANPENAELAFKAAELLEQTGDERRALRYADRAKFLGHERAEELADRLAAERFGG